MIHMILISDAHSIQYDKNFNVFQQKKNFIPTMTAF